MINLKYSSVTVAAIHNENPPGEGILNLMGSMFWGSLKKTPGTEVADDRDSTPYSGL